jgi:hypothetical protein
MEYKMPQKCGTAFPAVIAHRKARHGNKIAANSYTIGGGFVISS